MTHKLSAPNIHLFAFQERNDLTADSSPIEPENNLLWEKCDRIFDKLKIENLKLSQKLATHKHSDSPRVDLLRTDIKNDNISLPFEGNILLEDNQLIKIAGFAYPLQTHDSYALWLNLRRPDRENGQKTQDVDMSLLGKLNPDNCLLPEFIDSSLGQTLLITAGLTEGHNYQDKQVLKELADQCLQYFIPDPEKRPTFNRDGLLFGSSIFEYGIINQPPPYRHILVWLVGNSVTEIKFSKCYTELMDLFYYRNKIVRAYKDSRHVYQVIYEEYNKIEREIERLQELSEDKTLKEIELKRFKQLCKAIPKAALQYYQSMRDLARCCHTIGIDAQNYEEKINRIQKKLQSDNLSFLEVFFQKNCLYLQEEIQADLRYFEHGSGLLEKMLSAIRGMVEIERAQRDRYLQDTIQWLGIGTGTAIVIASSSLHLTAQNPIKPPFTSRSLHPFTLCLFASVAIGVATGAIARWFARVKARDR